MKKIAAALVFCCLCFSLYAQNETDRRYFDKSGKPVAASEAYYYRNLKDSSGFYKSYYVSNGTLYFEGKMLVLNNEDDNKSVYAGKCSWFHKNGNNKQIRVFDDKGIENGVSRYFYESGKLWKELEFVNGRLKNNTYVEYEEDGLRNKIFEEEFTDNRNDWDLYQSDKSHSKISEGFFELTSYSPEGTSRYINFPVNSNKYAVEAVLFFSNLKEQKESDRMGIIYGFKDWQNYHYFIISKKSIYIGSVFEGIFSNEVDGVECSAIKPAEKNNIKIICNGEKIYFSVNGQIFHSNKADKLYRSNFGIAVSGKSTVKVDRFVLKEIDGSESSTEGSPTDANVKATGSGLIISADGLIVTNHHVVDNASRFIIEVNTPSGKADYKAEVIQLDKENDLAVLKIKDDNFKPLSPLKYAFKENGGVEVGSTVFTIGYPYALAGMGKEAKFADGKISAKTGYNGAINSFQSTIPVQPGNSGGPVFNDKGQLVGLISSTIKQADNVSYAVKLNYINNIIDLLNDQVLRPADNSIALMSIEEKIKTLTAYVVLIKVK